MSQTKAGAAKATATLKRRHGEDFYSRIGKMGGQNGVGHQFAHGKVSPQEAGALGGRKSRRGKAKKVEAATITDEPLAEKNSKRFLKLWQR